MWITAAIIIGFLIDCILGDPVKLPHPVRLIGWWISALEKLYRRIFPKTPAGEKWAGIAMTLSVLLITGTAAGAVLWLLSKLHYMLVFVVYCIICWQVVAAKCLSLEAMKVQRVIEKNDLNSARYQISMLVGRDTANMSFEEVAKAAVETVAENTSDGVIAPLFWVMIAGPVGGLLYKAVNTMDSMVGYKNDRYIHFGRFAAKLDDLVNYLPARISALAMIAASFILRFDAKSAWKIWRRDRRKHASPNSAQTEAVCAGALNIRLAGNASYFGKVHEKPFIGDPVRAIKAEDIRNSCLLMRTASIISLVIFALIRFVFAII